MEICHFLIKREPWGTGNLIREDGFGGCGTGIGGVGVGASACNDSTPLFVSSTVWFLRPAFRYPKGRYCSCEGHCAFFNLSIHNRKPSFVSWFSSFLSSRVARNET